MTISTSDLGTSLGRGKAPVSSVADYKSGREGGRGTQARTAAKGGGRREG